MVKRLLLLTLPLWMGCTQTNNPTLPDIPLFTIINPKESGIDFRNDLKETLYANGLFYEYYYNGGGVATGDFNGDGWIDIYFISNLQSNKLYLNKGNLTFEDITKVANVSGKSLFPCGVTTVDINYDGLLDIYISSSGRFEDPNKRRNELYINQGNNADGIPTFQEKAAEYQLDIEEFSTQASFFDYDKDGDLDMFLINHDVEIYGDDKIATYKATPGNLSGERLYKNDQQRFVDITDKAGIINNRLGYGLGVAIGDVNNDSWPDIYVSHDFSGKDHLYINNRNGTFQEVSQESMRHISFFSMGNDMADYNNDGWLDIMTVDMVSEDNFGIKTSMSGMNPAQFYQLVDLGLHHQYMFNTLQLNNGTPVQEEIPYFSEVAQLGGVSNTDWSWAPLFFDMNNDGYQDLFVSNGIKRDFRNNDFVNYHKQVRAELSKRKTIDREAYINHMMSQMPTRKKPNYFFLNNGDLTFSSMNTPWQMDSLLTSSNGAAYADFDNDGDVDIVVNNMDDFAYLYQNQTIPSTSQHYLKIQLNGPNKNTLGIGAKITITHNDHQQLREQSLTRGFQSSISPIIHFGLGQDDNIDQLIIEWPDGKVQKLANIKADQLLVLDHEEAKPNDQTDTQSRNLIFTDLTDKTDLQHLHIENEFNDFARESLLPHRMSRFGPALAVADINGDQLDDVFIGGANRYTSSLYTQNPKGTFTAAHTSLFEATQQHEAVDAAFFDCDNDGDQDLYIVNGGNEEENGSGYYKDQLYINQNGKFEQLHTAIPPLSISGSCVRPFDYDQDGDLDLFIGGRQTPAAYPVPANSYLLHNHFQEKGNVSFTKAHTEKAPDLENIGMVTDAHWVDIDQDGLTDLVIVGEWMPITILKNVGGRFENQTEAYGLAQMTGWWSSIMAYDFDQDGDSDLVVGNLGLNYKYKASEAAPFEVFAADFDDNDSMDIVLGYYEDNHLFPLRGRECSSNQMPYIKEKFPSYASFASATIEEIVGKQELKEALNQKATTFATTYFENHQGRFIARPLPHLAQLSSVNAIELVDGNQDGLMDLVLMGNLYASEVETPRNDASYGLYLQGNGKGAFTPFYPYESGLFAKGDIKQSQQIIIDDIRHILLGANNQRLQLFQMGSVVK